MRVTLLPAVFSLFLTGTAVGQTNPTEAQSLQGILAEIRQLRQDLRTTTMAAQREQILMYRLQVQQAAVTRLQQRVDDAQSRLSQIQREEKQLSNSVKQNETALDNTSDTNDPKTRRAIEETVAQLKALLEAKANQEQETQAKLAESQDQLRLEQARLGGLQDELDRLDKALEQSAPRQGSAPQ